VRGLPFAERAAKLQSALGGSASSWHAWCAVQSVIMAAAEATAVVELVIHAPRAPDSRVSITRDLSQTPPESEALERAPYAHGFTGQHDGGALPASGRNAYAHVLECIVEAKAASDEALRALLPEAGAEGGRAPLGGGLDAGRARVSKKARLEEEENEEG